MRVGFIAGTLGRGGAERQLFYMLRALRAVGVECRVLCLTKGEAFEDPIQELGVEIEWVGSYPDRVRRMLAIVDRLRSRPVDIVQSSHFYTNIYAGGASRVLGLPCIGAIRNDLKSEVAAHGILGKWQLRLPTHLVANSHLAIDRAKRLGVDPKRLHFLGNVVDVQSTDGHEKRQETGGTHILFAGRLTPQKNPDLFVRLAARLLSELPDRQLTFEMAGDGPLREGLERLASSIGLTGGQFRFSGMYTDTENPYKRSDIIILTSDHEGTPNVILEAMANGVPVIATNVGGVSEVVDESRGVLVERGDLEGLVQAAITLVTDSDTRDRIGKGGKEYVALHHSAASLERSLPQLYTNVTGGVHANR